MNLLEQTLTHDLIRTHPFLSIDSPGMDLNSDTNSASILVLKTSKLALSELGLLELARELPISFGSCMMKCDNLSHNGLNSYMSMTDIKF